MAQTSRPCDARAPAAESTLARSWQRQGLRVRLALQPDEPRLIEDYLALGEVLAGDEGADAWALRERMLVLLLDTAEDRALPLVWRLCCVDACCRPLGRLGSMLHDDRSAARLQGLARRLALLSFSPDPCAWA